MTMSGTPSTGTENTNPPATPPVTPPAAPPVVTPPNTSATPPAAQQPPVTPPAAGGEPHQTEEEIKLTKAALSSRMARHTAQQLREQFGTENPEEIKTQLAKLRELEAEKETARLAQLSETERLNEQLRQRDSRIAELETEYDRAQTRQAVATVERRTTEMASKLFKGHAIPGVIDALRADTRNWAREDREDETRGYAAAERFMKDYLTRIPELGLAHQAPVVHTAPLTSGGVTGLPDRPQNPNGSPNLSGGAAKRVTDMTPAELAQWKKENGLNY